MRFRRFLVVFLVLLLAHQSYVYASIVGSAAKVAASVSGVIEAQLIRRGFAANDPRFQATLAAVSAVANNSVAGTAGAAAMALAGIAGLPVWATIAVGLGVGALVYGIYSFTKDSSGNLVYSAPGATDPAGSLYWTYTNKAGVTKTYLQNVSNANVICNDYWSSASYCGGSRTGSATTITSCTVTLSAGNACLPNPPPQYAPFNMMSSSVTPGSDYVVAPVTITGNMDTIAPSLPAAALAAPISDNSLAQVTDALYKQAAAQIGYSGIPYSMVDPVGATDAATWKAANPSAVPTMADVLSPIGSAVALPDPTAATSGSTTPTTLTPTPVDLGVDPGVAQPGLETTPTAAQILAPVLGLLPTLKSFVVPSHTATCPRPTASVWGKTLTLSGHCDLLDAPAVHDTLYAVMALVWTMVGLFIVLKA